MISRRAFVANMTAAAAAIAANAAQPAPPTQRDDRERPNILIFMPDQQQGSTILPGHPCITPNLDRFGREGLIFSRAYCPAPHCCPSRATFMTGLYPSEHGVFNNVDTDTAIHFDPYPGTRYFSQSLQDAGYALGYSGKWHVGHSLRPEDVGWANLNSERVTTNRPLGADHRSSAWRQAHNELERGAPRTTGTVMRPGWGNLQLFGTGKPMEDLRDYKIVQEGIAGVERFSGKQKPWCVMVSNNGGHDLYDPPQRFLDMYDWRTIELPKNFRDRMADKPRIYQRMRLQYWDQLSDDEVKQAIAHYYALLTMQDELFGMLLEALKKTGEAENTLVIYCSDHGDYAGAHGLWAKGVPSFREGYNIPCAVRWPKGIAQPGRVLEPLVSTADFAPTILEAAGIPGPRMTGASLCSWFGPDNPSQWRDTIFSQLNGVELYYTQRIVMTHTHKYVYNGFDFDEFYDLTNDPYELVNLAFPGNAPEPARGLPGEAGAWPPLASDLETIRRNLLAKMWVFAQETNDQIFNDYLTVAMAPLGPGIILGA